MLLFTPLQHVWTCHTQLKHSSQLLFDAASQADVVAWAIDACHMRNKSLPMIIPDSTSLQANSQTRPILKQGRDL